ncbi:putative flagellum biosynthesis repressor protein FlbT 1 [Alphaproteobacteria bacterium]|nr:putative flagellum biosynthesis repressor protein FlbT 1 [Alphaproteobacteria bacterium]
MPLKIELKPAERLIVGGAVITNGEERARLFIEGKAPILREKYVITRAMADTPCKLAYAIVLEMYLAADPALLHAEYFSTIRQIVTAAPSLMKAVDAMSSAILAGDCYEALKTGRALIDREERLLARRGRACG